MQKKLTLVSIYVKGVKYSAFIEMTGNKLTSKALHDMFPVLNTLERGETWSYG